MILFTKIFCLMEEIVFLFSWIKLFFIVIFQNFDLGGYMQRYVLTSPLQVITQENVQVKQVLENGAASRDTTMLKHK